MLIFKAQGLCITPLGMSTIWNGWKGKGLSPAARIQAEEQALIAGLKAVPRAERHRLREIPTEEAYDQWRLKMAEDAMKEAAGQAEEQIKVWERTV